MPRNTTLIAGGRYQTEIFLGQRFGRSGLRLIGTSQVTKQLLLEHALRLWAEDPVCRSPLSGPGKRRHVQRDLSSLGKAPLRASPWPIRISTRSADGTKEYDYTIIRSQNTYQVNKYLFFRAIVEYNSFYKRLMTDLLASFTYIPGTVVHVGYGSLYEKLEWREGEYEPSDRFLETKRGFFFKVSYLWRL